MEAQNHWFPETQKISMLKAAIRLNLNFYICEQLSESIATTSHQLVSYCTIHKVKLLSAHLIQGPALDSAHDKKLDDLKRVSERLQLISADYALVHLRASSRASS